MQMIRLEISTDILKVFLVEYRCEKNRNKSMWGIIR